MNRALWKKAFGEVRLTMPAFVLLMYVFQILFVWLTSQFNLEYIELILRGLPDAWKRQMSVSIESVTTYAGRVAIGYEHPLVSIGMAYWAISRGSDAVSGPLGRGTLELTLAQPVRRVWVLTANATVTGLGCLLIASACWLGTLTGLHIIPKMQGIPAEPYLGCAGNLFSYGLFLAGVSTLVSSFDRSRGRTIGLIVIYFVASTLLKFVGKIADRYQPLLYFSFLAAFEPQRFVDAHYDSHQLLFWYDLPLVMGGAFCYVLATCIFSYRDLPAPL